MLLIHDLVEIDAGDTFLYDTQKNHDNTEEERLAAERIFGLLPGQQGAELKALWEEFEAGETPEAAFAKTLDRLEPILQNASNQGGTWQEFDVHYDQVYAKVKHMAAGSESLWDYAQHVLDESIAQGILKK